MLTTTNGDPVPSGTTPVEPDRAEGVEALRPHPKIVIEPLGFTAADLARAENDLDSDVHQARRKGTVTTKTVVLTPALAFALLRRNPGNRLIRMDSLREMMSDIEAGRFILNGETIVVSDDGQLNDGQHRCIAVAKTGMPIRTVIAIGVTRDSRMTVDMGRPRTAGNFLNMMGEPSGSLGAAAANYMIQWQDRQQVSGNSRFRPSKSKIVEFYHENRDRIQAALSLTKTAPDRLFGGPSGLAFMLIVLSEVDRAQAASFMERLLDGAGLEKGNPILYTRNRLMAEGGMDIGSRTELIFRTWNLWRRDQMGVVRIPLNGSIPRPI